MTESSGTQVIASERHVLKIRRLRLEVKKGPDKGATFELDDEPIRIGTSSGCEVRLTDGTVSGMHAELSRNKFGLLLKDLGSTNGTYVNDQRVLGVYLNDTATIQLGASNLKVWPLAQESAVELAADDRFGDILGASLPMRALFAKLRRVADADTTVLITGETGTGKELVAAAIRDHSNRKNKPFVVVDCGALPGNLIESELLGHERGSFTGAERTRAGAFERAHGGTIFLDEIGELPLSLQPALLGILERREVRRVGGQATFPVDVRVLAATNRDLAAEVARGAFRADLYYRLAIVEVRLPPLRERSDDVPVLIDHFLRELPGARPTLSKEMIQQLKDYSWPGNVRELRNVIERAMLLAEPPTPQNSGAPKIKENTPTHLTADIDRPFKDQKNALIEGFERVYVKALIQATGGNIAAAARKAQIDRMYLYKLLERYQVDAELSTSKK